MYIRATNRAIINLTGVQSVERVHLFDEKYVVNAIGGTGALELFRGTSSQCNEYLDFLWSQLDRAQVTVAPMKG